MKNHSRSEEDNLEVVKFLSELGPKPYSYEDLQIFTSNFSQHIGCGGYGEVYKGQFPDGVHIAVKILAEKDFVEETFMAEVRTMGKAYHRNLVKLYGYCFEHDTKALVYEYMENGSLDKILYNNHEGTIEWEKLYGIAIEMAKGVDYLHDGWDERIIHYDIKAGNVLLDKNLSPKITDFGLAKLMKRDVSRVPLSRTRGTVGYNAPETWMPSSQVTYKCDVYSYGMMLFEVLGKRRNGNGDNWFPKRVWEKYKNGQLAQLIKDCGIKKKDSEKAKILSKVALWCAQYTPEIRPSMSDVVLMLQKKIPVDTPPYPFHFGQSLDSSVLVSPTLPKFLLEVFPTIDERQSLDSSVLPPTSEVIPEVGFKVHTNYEWQFWDSSVLSPTPPEACLGVSPTIDESLLIKACKVSPRMLLPPPPRELRVEDHSKGSPTIDDSLLVKTGGSSSYISRKFGKMFGNEKEKEKGLSSLFRSLHTGSEGSVFFFDRIPQFELKDLLRATAEALGSGDFGRTYKQVLKSGDVVCVSSLEKIHDEENLQEKLHLYLGRLRHENLVSLKAYYFSAGEKLLVSEYMPNGSLFSILHSNGNHHKRIPLDWTTRLKFALKVARGLFFIHHYSTHTYPRSHGNIKSTNVLIDAMGNPRLTDFGLSSFASPKIMKRPNGYRAPETLLKKNHFSHQEADIYAFGILLLEIVTGIWPCKYESYGVVDFPGMVQSVVREEWMTKVFDLELKMYKHSEDEMIKLVQIALSCTSFSPNDRPSITSVMCMIEDIGKVEEGGDIKKYSPENIKKLKRFNHRDFSDYSPRI